MFDNKLLTVFAGYRFYPVISEVFSLVYWLEDFKGRQLFAFDKFEDFVH